MPLDQPSAEAAQLDRIAAEAPQAVGALPTEIVRLTHSRVTRGVWRVTAAGQTAVVKVLIPPEPGHPEASDPTSMRYWLREPLLYSAGIPEPYLAAGVRGPRLLARFDRPDGDIALWLEDVPGVPGTGWDLEAFARAVRRLGRAQGSYATGRPLPHSPWLSRGFLRQYLASRLPKDDELLASDDAWRQPSIARHFPVELRDALRRLRADREVLLSWLETAPPVFAHLDVWPDNLFDTGSELILIDWGFAGAGSAGEDIGNLVPDSIFDLRHPASMLHELDRTVFTAYLAGFRDAGWLGDERLIRLGMTAAACKYDWIAGAVLDRATVNTATQKIYGGVDVNAEELFASRAAALSLLVEWAEEAHGLARELGL